MGSLFPVISANKSTNSHLSSSLSYNILLKTTVASDTHDHVHSFL